MSGNKKTTILMSAENPTGFKLEELLAAIVTDLHTKNEIMENEDSCTEAERIIRANNLKIIDKLERATSTQLNTMAYLKSLGQDTGPHGKKRTVK